MADKPERKSSRPPEYQVSCLNKQTEERGAVGAAWVNPDGSIRVVINAFVVLPEPRYCVLTLFPSISKPKPQPKSEGASGNPAAEPEQPF